MVTRIIIGGIMVIIGFLLVWKTAWLVNNFGRIPWFEQHMGTIGGSWAAYKMFGIIAITTGLLVMTNLHQQVASSILTPLFGRGK